MPFIVHVLTILVFHIDNVNTRNVDEAGENILVGN